MNAPLAGHAAKHPVWDSRRLWSLWDMIDFQLGKFLKALDHVKAAETFLLPTKNSTAFIEPNRKALVRDLICPAGISGGQLQMPTVISRIAKITVMLDEPGTRFNEMAHEVDELLDAIRHDADQSLFCHYQENRVLHLHLLPVQWSDALRAFPSIKTEAEEGIDCYALGHNTACVFHMARIAEVGLRAIGRERGVKAVRGVVPIEWGTWGQVFQAIEPTIEKIRKTKPNGPKKTNALAFYDRILSDLHAIQSLYRDQTMHLRDRYDDGEAQSAMFRVRELMTTLASKLNENSTRAVPWNAWK